MNDNGLAALAARLPDALTYSDDYPYDLDPVGTATNILAGGAVFLPDGHDDCPYCAGEMCARFDGLNCQHDMEERHGYFTPTIAEQAATIATLRAALDGLVKATERIDRQIGLGFGTDLSRESADDLRAALAKAKEAGG
jgi:hypothetical protein